MSIPSEEMSDDEYSYSEEEDQEFFPTLDDFDTAAARVAAAVRSQQTNIEPNLLTKARRELDKMTIKHAANNVRRQLSGEHSPLGEEYESEVLGVSEDSINLANCVLDEWIKVKSPGSLSVSYEEKKLRKHQNFVNFMRDDRNSPEEKRSYHERYMREGGKFFLLTKPSYVVDQAILEYAKQYRGINYEGSVGRAIERMRAYDSSNRINKQSIFNQTARRRLIEMRDLPRRAAEQRNTNQTHLQTVQSRQTNTNQTHLQVLQNQQVNTNQTHLQRLQSRQTNRGSNTQTLY